MKYVRANHFVSPSDSFWDALSGRNHSIAITGGAAPDYDRPGLQPQPKPIVVLDGDNSAFSLRLKGDFHRRRGQRPRLNVEKDFRPERANHFLPPTGRIASGLTTF